MLEETEYCVEYSFVYFSRISALNLFQSMINLKLIFFQKLLNRLFHNKEMILIKHECFFVKHGFFFHQLKKIVIKNNSIRFDNLFDIFESFNHSTDYAATEAASWIILKWKFYNKSNDKQSLLDNISKRFLIIPSFLFAILYIFIQHDRSFFIESSRNFIDLPARLKILKFCQSKLAVRLAI